MPQLTFTRFIAAALIVVYHFETISFIPKGSIFYNFVELAPIGISYFFLLSGFILSFSYYDYLNKKSFYQARLARIYPVYLFALLLTLIYFLLKGDYINFKAIILNLTLLQSWSPFFSTSLNYPGWSLSVEAFFYLLFPFLLYSLKKISKKIVLVIISLLIWSISFYLYYLEFNNYLITKSFLTHNIIYYNPLFHINSFILGITSYLIFRQIKESISKIQSTALILIPLTIIVWLVTINHPILRYHHNGLLAPLFSIFIIGLASDKTFISKILSQKPLILLGEISYGIYILQAPTYFFWEITYEPYLINYPILNFLLFFIILIIISWVTYEIIEKPIRKMVRKETI